MKVAFIARATLFSSYGGDTKQVEETAANLRVLGIAVDIKLTNDTIDYASYDLLHFFNIIRPADIMVHIKRAGKPYVVSTIFVDYGSFEKKGRTGILRFLGKVFSEDGLEYIKAMARWIKNGEQVMSREYLWKGHRKSVRYVATHAAMLLPNSESEYYRFATKYSVACPHTVVSNGIDLRLAQRSLVKKKEYEDTVVCAARIEEIKNQLNLIRALRNTKYTLFIHGQASPNNVAYYEKCKAEATANIHIMPWIDQEEMYTVFASARVHVLPSYFETTGLSSLEAAVMGCNIVVTECGDTREYFGDHAWYCDPDDPASIKQAIDNAFEAPYNEGFRQYILKNYTWAKAAKQTLAAYNTVLE